MREREREKDLLNGQKDKKDIKTLINNDDDQTYKKKKRLFRRRRRRWRRRCTKTHNVNFTKN